MPLSPEDLRFNPPSFDPARLESAAAELFEIRGELEPLVGERDQNALITTAEGRKYVLKVSGALEDPQITDLQTQALLHLERTAPELPVPRVIPSRSGLPSERIPGEGGASHVVRLLDHLPGITFEKARAISGVDLRAIGEFQGRVCRALSSFVHPAARHFTPWNVLNGLLDSEELWAHASENTREIAGTIRKHLVEHALPAMDRLRSQVIHGDAHSGNLLRPNASSHRVCGLIDFGDMVDAPMAIDLAVLAASFVPANAPEDAASVVVSLTRGFNAAIPLSAEEVDQLHDLVLARYVLSALLFDFQIATCSGSELVPAEREAVIDVLRGWLQIDAAELTRQLRLALEPKNT